MDLSHKSQKILISGRSGSGKSTYATDFMLRVDAKKFFIFDHQGEFHSRLGVPVCESVDDLENQLEEKDQPFLCYDPSREFAGETNEAFAWFCDWSFAVNEHLPERNFFVADELQQLVDQYTIPISFRKILETGRRHKLDMVMISQQINTVHNRIRNQLTELVVFDTPDPRARDILEQHGLEKAEHLPDGSFIAKDLYTGKFFDGKIF